MKKFIIYLFILFIPLLTLKAKIYYVNPNGSDNNNGNDWANSFSTLQKALESAQNGDEIWVSEGTYYPTIDNGLYIGTNGKHFRLKSDVSLIGGFPPIGNPTFAMRNHFIYKSIISGDLNQDDKWNEDLNIWENINDNCYHLFFNPKKNSSINSALIDGFYLQSANANGDDIHHNGGAICLYNSNIHLNNCIFQFNIAKYGGALFFEESIVKIKNSFIMNNISDQDGGGIYIFKSDLDMVNCIIADNKALNKTGGGIFAYFTTSKYDNMNLINCTIANNFSLLEGGGILIASQTTYLISEEVGNTQILNSILYSNKSKLMPLSNELYVAYTYSYSKEDINLGKATLDYCLVGSGIDSKRHDGKEWGINKKFCIQGVDPKFSSSETHPYLISNNSMCVDAGLNDYIFEEFDIRGIGFPENLIR